MKGIYLKMKTHVSNYDANNYKEMILMVKELNVHFVLQKKQNIKIKFVYKKYLFSYFGGFFDDFFLNVNINTNVCSNKIKINKQISII